MSDFDSMQNYERLKAALSSSPEPALRRRRRFLGLFRHQLQRAVLVEPVQITSPPAETEAQPVTAPETTDGQPKTYYFNAAGWSPPEGSPDLELDDETD